MPSLTDQEINNTYSGLIKTIDSLELPESGRTCLSDGQGGESSLEIGQCGEGAKIKGSVNVTGDITQPAACTSTLGIVNICDTLNVVNDTCLASNLTVTGDTCTNGNNCLGALDNLTSIPGYLTVGGSQAASSRITSVPLNSNESGLTICSANNSPYVRFCTPFTQYSIGLDANDNSNFKISTGNSVNGSNNFVVRAGGLVNINSTSGTDNLTVGGSGLFTNNLTTDGNFILKAGGICSTNGLGTAGDVLQSTGSKIQWVTPSGGSCCFGNICDSTGSGTVYTVPKWQNSTTLMDSGISENGNIVNIANSLSVDCNTTVSGYLKLDSVLRDSTNSQGSNGQILEATGSGVKWVTSTGTSCTGNVAGGGTVNTISKFTGGTAIGDSVIKEAVSNIGIDALPTGSYKLSVGGSVCATGFTGNLTGNITSSTTVGGSMTASGAVKGSIFSNTNSTAVITEAGDVLARNITAGGDICTLGTVRSAGDIIAFTTSDERLKDNITCISDSNNIINNLNGYCFDWNDKSEREGTSTGLIAQEVQKVLPNAVCERDNGYLAVDYIQLIPVMVEELKRLNKIVSKLESHSQHSLV